MKKKLFVFLIFVFSLLYHNPSTISAQQIDGSIEIQGGEVEMMIDPMASASSKVNYELPYPGMLPDNPFYFLKMIRDRVIKTLISDPFKRAQFNLLTAQKRMYAGKLLVDKEKHALALETIEKSNNYLDEALSEIRNARQSNTKNVDINPLLGHFRTVTLKHLEVIEEIISRLEGQNLEKAEWQKTRLENTKKSVENLINPSK